MQGNTDLRTVKVTHLWFLSRKVMKPFNTTQIKGKTNSTVVSYFARFYTCQQLIWLWFVIDEKVWNRAMCCCRGRGSSWRTGGTAGAYEDDTQTARARLPTQRGKQRERVFLGLRDEAFFHGQSRQSKEDPGEQVHVYLGNIK